MPRSPNAPAGPRLHAPDVPLPLPGTPSPTLPRGEPHSALLSAPQEAFCDAHLPRAKLAFLWALLLPGQLWSTGSSTGLSPQGAWRAMHVVLSEVLNGAGL